MLHVSHKCVLATTVIQSCYVIGVERFTNLMVGYTSGFGVTVWVLYDTVYAMVHRTQNTTAVLYFI